MAFLYVKAVKKGVELQAVVIWRESVALVEVASLQAFFQPTHTLFRSAVGEEVALHVAVAGLALQVVVADLLCSVDGFLEVAVFERAEHLLLVMAPNAGIVVGLQLDADAHLVGFGLVHAGHLLVGLVERTEEVLDVVTHFVGDDVGAGEVALDAHRLLHLVEEIEVEIEFLVGRAIERACGRGGVAAAALHRALEEHHLGGAILGVILGELSRPNVFGRSQDLRGKKLEFLLLGRGDVFRRCATLRLLHLFHNSASVAAHQANDKINDKSADANASGGHSSTFSTAVFDVGAGSSAIHFHSSTIFKINVRQKYKKVEMEKNYRKNKRMDTMAV